MLPYGLQIVNHMNMVRNAIDNVDIGKIAQPLARKVRALETPGYLFPFGTLAEAVSALHAEGYHTVGKTTITANFFDGNAACLGNFG